MRSTGVAPIGSNDIRSTDALHRSPFFGATWVVETPLAVQQDGGCDAALKDSNPAPPRALSTGGARAWCAFRTRSDVPRPRSPEAFQEATEPTGGGLVQRGRRKPFANDYSACKVKFALEHTGNSKNLHFRIVSPARTQGPWSGVSMGASARGSRSNSSHSS